MYKASDDYVVFQAATPDTGGWSREARDFAVAKGVRFSVMRTQKHPPPGMVYMSIFVIQFEDAEDSHRWHFIGHPTQEDSSVFEAMVCEAMKDGLTRGGDPGVARAVSE